MVLALVVAGLTSPANAQRKKNSIKKILRDANADYSEGLYAPAWNSYRHVLAGDPSNDKAAVNAAHSAMILGYPADSLRLLKSSLESARSHESLYFLARISHYDRKFDESVQLLRKYGEIAPGKRLFSNDEVALAESYSRNAKDIAERPTTASIRNMGKNINSVFADYVPVIMPDESALYFTSRRKNPEHPARNGDGTFYEDIYVSLRENGAWQPATSVGFPLNTETNDACVAISPDGQRMIIYRTAANISTGDLFLTVMGADGRWTTPKKMTDKINSPHIETSACFSNDTSEIFFSSDRPGGLGGKDLYRIRKLGNGKWSEPMNLGPKVNTPFDDDAPFLHPDGVTLYFSSKGHDSMGDFDVFRAVWSNEENSFSEAVNLGHPINDVGADIFFVLSADGQRAYYTTTRNGDLGGTDLYEINTRFGSTDLRIITGKIVLGREYGRAQITVKQKDSDELNGIYLSHPRSGKFILAVRPHQQYEATIVADGFTSQKVTLSPDHFDDEKAMTFVLLNADAE